MVSSSFHGALSRSMPLPFMRSGESAGRTSSSAIQADFAGSAAAERRNWPSERRS